MDEKPPSPPADSTLPAHSKVTLFVGVPITLIVLAVAVWALLSGMPFATDSRKLTRTQQPAPSVVNEQPGTTATTSEIRGPGDQPQAPVSGAGRGTEVISTTTTAMPAAMPVPAPPPPQPVTQRPPLPPATQTAVVAPPVAAPVPVRRTPPPATRPAETSTAATSEITESQGEDIVLRYVTSRDYYGLGSADCVGAVSQGYKNRGYAIDVVDRCGDRGRVGRWRVDSVTREVFVEKADGRYLRP